MKLFERIAIVGTGLIGGSLALAIKKHHLAEEVIGVSRHMKSLKLAKKKGAIDRASQSLEIIKDADFVILATPVDVILEQASRIAKIIKKDCLVTDVGSTKEKIVAKLEKTFANYIGSHPLAGSEKRGISSAKADLFKHSLCILTPTALTDKKSLRLLSKFWNKVGARVETLDPKRHDKILSFVSHMPHIAAFSLIGAVPKQFLKFASGGLKDTTRIAASDSELWAEIFLSNSKNVLQAIKALKGNILEIEKEIKNRDKKKLSINIEKARLKRETLQ